MNSRAENQRSFLKTVYSKISSRYELTNHVLTFGLDVMWRKKAAKMAIGYFAREREETGEAGGLPDGLMLDVCTGTGEMAGLLSREAGLQRRKAGLQRREALGRTRILGLDFSKEMLLEATAKEVPDSTGPFGAGQGTSYLCADMDRIPFPDDTFDLVTMAFAMRNNNPDRETLSRRLREIRRVLRPGGVFVNLETSQPSNVVLRRLRDMFTKYYVRIMGGLISGDRPGFSYLASSIRGFYGADELGAIFESAGLVKIDIKRLLLSMTAVHIYRK